MAEGTDQENELPTLVLGHAILEGGHGPAALGNLIEDLAVGDGTHPLGVGKISGERGMRSGLGAVAFAEVAVALGAVV